MSKEEEVKVLLCEWCDKRHLPEDECEEEPYDVDDFDTGGYSGMYQR